MLLGAAMLAVIALVTGERLVVPARPETWLAMAYLVGPGSIAVFVLVLYVLAHWTASATSYGFLFFPLVAIVFGGILLGEPILPSFLLGGSDCPGRGVRRGRPSAGRPCERTTRPRGRLKVSQMASSPGGSNSRLGPRPHAGDRAARGDGVHRPGRRLDHAAAAAAVRHVARGDADRPRPADELVRDPHRRRSAGRRVPRGAGRAAPARSRSGSAPMPPPTS